jgi:hypothetical protein
MANTLKNQGPPISIIIAISKFMNYVQETHIKKILSSVKGVRDETGSL